MALFSERRAYMSEYKFNTIEEIIDDIKKGKNIILADAESRENEGDVICAAEYATPENAAGQVPRGRRAPCCLVC